jgi:hypothetical protein
MQMPPHPLCGSGTDCQNARSESLVPSDVATHLSQFADLEQLSNVNRHFPVPWHAGDREKPQEAATLKEFPSASR